MSFTQDRERRKTAGKRVTELVGEDLENDATFWSHETWAEEDESGNESFHESDEDSDLRRDNFDSDFDESESDHEQQDEDEGAAEEAQLRQEELSRHRHRKQQQQRSYVDMAASKGRQALLKKKKPGKKLVTGEGINAGIVLNLPTLTTAATSLSTQLQPAASLPPTAPVSTLSSLPPSSQTAETTLSSVKSHSQSVHKTKVTLAATRPRRATKKLSKYTSRFRTARTDANPPLLPEPTVSTSGSHSHHQSSQSQQQQRSRRRLYKQEELLLEAANETEPDNQRWILARKRYQEQYSNENSTTTKSARSSDGKVIEKYTSRRGYLNIITFPEMDHVPEIFTQSRQQNTTKHTQPTDMNSVTTSAMTCVITGKQARYRDPLTLLPYHDAAAFRELRRRHLAGEQILPAIENTVAAATLDATTSMAETIVSGGRIASMAKTIVSGDKIATINESSSSTAVAPTLEMLVADSKNKNNSNVNDIETAVKRNAILASNGTDTSIRASNPEAPLNGTSSSHPTTTLYASSHLKDHPKPSGVLTTSKTTTSASLLMPASPVLTLDHFESAQINSENSAVIKTHHLPQHVKDPQTFSDALTTSGATSDTILTTHATPSLTLEQHKSTQNGDHVITGQVNATLDQADSVSVEKGLSLNSNYDIKEVECTGEATANSNNRVANHVDTTFSPVNKRKMAEGILVQPSPSSPSSSTTARRSPRRRKLSIRAEESLETSCIILPTLFPSLGADASALTQKPISTTSKFNADTASTSTITTKSVSESIATKKAHIDDLLFQTNVCSTSPSPRKEHDEVD